MGIDDEIIKQFKRNLEISLPCCVKDCDCKAAAICQYIGNIRESCMKGYSSPIPVENTSKCIEGMVILLGRIAGITLEPPPASKEIRGFSDQPPKAEDEESAG